MIFDEEGYEFGEGEEYDTTIEAEEIEQNRVAKLLQVLILRITKTPTVSWYNSLPALMNIRYV